MFLYVAAYLVHILYIICIMLIGHNGLLFEINYYYLSFIIYAMFVLASVAIKD